jgi:hypothetical protein
MLFKKPVRRQSAPSARRVAAATEEKWRLTSLTNGPQTPVIAIEAMRRALSHAAWRDPSVERRKNDEVRAVIRTLERTAACVDIVLERLSEAATTLTAGKATTDQVMRGLLTARFDELLDSLERVAKLAQDGPINLLGAVTPSTGPTARLNVSSSQNRLSLEIGSAGFIYILNPIDIRRGRTGLAIPVLESGFDNNDETYEVETALLRAQQRLTNFSDRLSQDALMLVKIAQETELKDDASALSPDDFALSPANDRPTQTEGMHDT